MSSPSSRKTLAFSYLRQALADSDVFQQWVGEETAEDALTHIYADALPRGTGGGYLTADELAAYRPFAILRDERFSSSPEAWPPTSTSAVVIEGEVSITLEEAVAPGADNYTAYLDFHNTVGDIIDDLWITCTAPSEEAGLHLIPARIATDEGSHRADDDELQAEGDYQSIQITVEWGPSK